MNEPHTDMKEAVTSIEVSAQLLISVTRRLFIALTILFGLSLGNSGKINGGLWANSTMTAGTTCCRFMVARALILLASQSL